MTKTSRPLNMFISYCHKDESYLDELKKHLVTLKRKGIFHEWSDRELVAGDHLDSEIEAQLQNSDLVAFLISIDFLNSWYCFEMELKNALQRLDNGEVRIIPIIVRSCKWNDTVLGNYLAATKDGKPIAKYEDSDDAWVEVVNSIEKAADKYLKSKSDKNNNDPASIDTQPALDPSFVDKLNDTEVSFQHKYKEQITLEDIFVYPDLKNIKQEYDEIETTINSEQLTNVTSSSTKLLILGGEQSGKTSLAKTLFKNYYAKGYLPLLCDGREIRTTDIRKILRKLMSDQYLNLTSDQYLSKDRIKILIVDDFDKLTINIRYRTKCLQNASELTDKLVLISDSAIKYNEPQLLELSDYSQYEILPFGNERRGALIEKWNSIGRIETINIKELHDQSDYVSHHVNSVIRKNILPPKPIYVLTIIQLLDTVKPTDYSLTSYGHCYQSLIQTALKKSKIKVSDFDLYINYLSEIAYYIFCTGKESVNNDQLAVFKSKYSESYLVRSHDEVISALLVSSILRQHDEGIRFSYRYIFYFYVAKYLSDHIEINDCKKEIERLCENIHTEKNANILIFLVHHTKDQDIIDEILLHASVVFDKTKEASLDIEDTKYLLEYIVSIPKLVIEQRNIDQERRKRLTEKDERDGIGKDEDISDSDSEEEMDQGILSEINRSVRLVEIIGQILRNRHGSLTKTQLTDLTLSAYSSGLKFLSFFLTTTRKNHDYILKFIQDIFKENTKLSDDDISKEARKIFLMLCYGTSYSVIKKIANSVGTDKLMPIFEEITNSHQESPAIQLIYIAIQLEFTKKIPKKVIAETYLELQGNPIAQRLLQEIVIQHLYLNHVEFRERQWISDKLKLPMASQRLLQGKSELKK